MNDLATFFEMGGYAAYIWPAYGLTAVTFALMLGLTLRTLRTRRNAERDLAASGRARRTRREAQS